MSEITFSTSQRDEYLRSGYIRVKNLLSIEKITEVERQASQIFYEQIKFLNALDAIDKDNDTIYSRMKLLFSLDRDRYLSCLRIIARLYSLQTLMTDPAICKIVEAIGLALPVMQSRTIFHVMSNNLRFPNGYFGFDVHQDWPSLQSSLDMVTVWIPLVDVGVDNFPLEVIPGSHLKGFLGGAMTEHLHLIDTKEYQESDFIPLTANRGDVIFMCAFSLHRSAVRPYSNELRLAASGRYENALEPNVIAHAYPYCQHNVVKRDLIVENFPTREQVLSIFEDDENGA